MSTGYVCPGLLCLSKLPATDVGVSRRLVKRGADRLSLLPKLGTALNEARMLLLEIQELHTGWLGRCACIGYSLLNFGELCPARHKTNLPLIASRSPLPIPSQN